MKSGSCCPYGILGRSLEARERTSQRWRGCQERQDRPWRARLRRAEPFWKDRKCSSDPGHDFILVVNSERCDWIRLIVSQFAWFDKARSEKRVPWMDR